MTRPEPITLVYKRIGDLDLALDIYAPPTADTSKIAALVYFHGGGLTVGDRTSWFPTWLYERLAKEGIAFISADYRLMPPSYGPDILSDVLDVLTFIRDDLNGALDTKGLTLSIDPERIGVSGTSAGSLCAYLAAAHLRPRPQVVLSLCGMGGNMFTKHLVTRKTEPFWKGYEMLDPRAEPYATYTHPRCLQLPPLASSSLAFHGPDSPTPGYPANPRMQLARLYIQEGIYADYWAGEHEPSLSGRVAELLDGGADAEAIDAWLAKELSQDLVSLFPQLLVGADWPPSVLVHGEADTAVHADESRYLHSKMVRAGAHAELRILPGEEHSFDYSPGADGRYGVPGGLYDELVGFVSRYLKV
ncbi:unnamed protein product [Peniophora sp. CBMAI 1063]|nr:unnamed protein product [Peniophora sp. CBMAI 1063]